MFDIRIGTVLLAGQALSMIPKLAPYRFESYQITFGGSTEGYDLPEMGKRVQDALSETGAVLSGIGVYANPLVDSGKFAGSLQSLEQAIDHARAFGCDLVSAFAGRLPGCPPEESIPRFKEVFLPLARRAADQGVRLAFENCAMDGTRQQGEWNIATDPGMWERMFDAVPMDNLGLEWEPAHQLRALIDPVPQLRAWAPRVFHVHGKDATIAWDVLRTHGLLSPVPYSWDRTPGFGDSNWADLITILRMSGYRGTIDIEGYHDPVYNTEALEWPSQVHSLKYLKGCRGGEEWVPLAFTRP